MPARLLLILLVLFTWSPGHAQAPASVDRKDVAGHYVRPNLTAPLFDPAVLPLSIDQTNALVRSLVLIARNFPDHPAVTHRLRARALAVALRLRADDRSAVVANGQLARGIAPEPLPSDPPATLSGTAASLFEAAAPLSQAAENEGRRLGLLLLDLATTLDPRLRRKASFLTYLTVPDWRETPVVSIPLESPHTFQLREATVRVLLPGLREGALQWLAVQTKTIPAPGKKGLRVALPPPLLQAITAKNAGDLRSRVEQRMNSLRTALRQRHASWPDGWSVEITATGGPPDQLPVLFTGMALTLDALLSGNPLNERCLIAAVMDGTGVLHPVMPAGELLVAAALSPEPPVLILSARSAEEITDWLLLRPDQWPLLYRVTMHQTSELTDAFVLSRQARAPRLSQALQLFDTVAARLAAASDPLAELRKPETVGQLRDVLVWHAGHLSASALLRVAEPGNATLSVRGSLARIDALAGPVLSLDRKKFPLHIPVETLKKSEFLSAVERLQANAKMLHPEVRSYISEVVALGKLLDRACGHWNAYLRNNGPPEPPEVAARRRTAESARAVLETR